VSGKRGEEGTKRANIRAKIYFLYILTLHSTHTYKYIRTKRNERRVEKSTSTLHTTEHGDRGLEDVVRG
jgi:hypothetical protein